jgi:hypothetical protein
MPAMSVYQDERTGAMANTPRGSGKGIAKPAPRIAAESPQQARSASVVRARTCSAEPEFGAQIIQHGITELPTLSADSIHRGLRPKKEAVGKPSI